MMQKVFFIGLMLLGSIKVFALSDSKLDEIYSKANGFDDRNRAKLKTYFQEMKKPGYKRSDKPRVLKRWPTKEAFLAAAKNTEARPVTLEPQDFNNEEMKNENTNSVGDKTEEEISQSQGGTRSESTSPHSEASKNGSGPLGDDTQWQTVGPLGPNIRKESQEAKTLTPEELQYEKEKEEFLKKFKK